jgi:hypothetical protein
MAIKDITESAQCYKSRLVGLSTDTKPTSGVWDGSTFEELDTGAKYLLLSGIWYKVPSNAIDIIADIEIDGTPVTNRRAAASASGDTTLVTIAAGERVKVYKAILSVSADISGEVILKVGVTQVGSVHNPKSGGQYVLLSSFPDFEYGAAGEDIVLSLPSATSVSINISYEVVSV